LARLRILHLHPSFDRNAQALRSVQLINAFGRGCEHAIVSAEPGEMAAASQIHHGIVVDLSPGFPVLRGRPTPGRLQRLARAMSGHDLVLSYGFSAMDAVMANTVFGGHLPLPPLVHHEDEAGDARFARNWYRRIALGRAAALVVPSRELETMAVDLWHQPRSRVKRIAPGIRTAALAARPRRDALPRVIKRDGELWLGALAGSTSARDLSRLVRVLAALPAMWQLVILNSAGHGDAIRDEAIRLDFGHRVHLPGPVAEPGQVMGLFDLFVLPSVSDQALVEAMASGLAVVADDVGDVAATLAPQNHPFLVAPADDAALAAALEKLAQNPALRASVGAANRKLARANHDEAGMVAACRSVYGAALGRTSFP
jgi:glycosyltransferase involved in cell wall biosynthesis